MVKAKMTYFPFHGLGEPLRFMMAYTSVEWSEEIVSIEEFPARKPSFIFKCTYALVEGKLPQKSNKFVVKNHKMRKKQSLCAGFPFGKLPILEMDGMKMHQSAAIIRYLARKAGGTLYGRNEFEALQCDVAYDTISDLRVMMLGYFYEPLMESSEEKKKLVLEELAPMYLRNLEKLVNDNGGYFVGGQLTWVDIAYASLIDYLSHMAGKELVADKPALKALRNRVFELPAIKKYVETRVKYAY